jgi:hypothetical protein
MRLLFIADYPEIVGVVFRVVELASFFCHLLFRPITTRPAFQDWAQGRYFTIRVFSGTKRPAAEKAMFHGASPFSGCLKLSSRIVTFHFFSSHMQSEMTYVAVMIRLCSKIGFHHQRKI